MKLSQAMRAGSKMCEQSFNNWIGPNGEGCALTQAMLGAGIIDDIRDAAHALCVFQYIYPIAVDKVRCPVCNDRELLDFSIIHLNDAHRWPTARIAGWIEAHIEAPTYSLLDLQHYMEDTDKSEVPHV